MAAGVVALVAAGCNGDDTSSATTSPSTVATTAPTTPAPTTADTTVPATTDATTVPTEPSTTTATTDLPTPTTDNTVVQPEVQDIVDALTASWTAFGEVLLDPYDDEKLALVRDRERGDALKASLDIVEDFRLRGLRTVENPDVPSQLVPLPESVVIVGSEATIEYCWVNSDLVVETGGNADGTDRIVEAEIFVSLDRESYELIDGKWRKVSGVVLSTHEETTCDAVL